jgi:hypothetical protein
VLAQGSLGALALRERKDEGEETARREDARGCGRVVGDAAANLDARRHGLRMRSLDGSARRKVRRRPGDEVERPFVIEIPQIPLPHIDTILESVVPDTLPRQPHGHRLRLDGDDPRANQTPRHDERHRPNTRPKVRRPPHPRRPLRRIPGGEDVIGREAMPIGILEDAVMPRDVVERLPDLRLDAAGREGAGTKPATVMEVGGHGGGMVVHLRWSCLAGSGFRASV